MSDPGQVTCAVCGSANPAAAPVCQSCGRALPGLADRLFAAEPGAAPAPPAPVSTAPTPAPPPAPPAPPAPHAPDPTEAAPAAEPGWQPPEDALATWTSAGTVAEPDEGPPERPRSRTLLLLAAIVGVLALAAVAYLLFGQGDDTDPDAASTTTAASEATTTTVAPTTTSALAPTPPAEPTNLAVAPASSTSLSMTWIDAADNEDRYLVARVRGDVFDQIADLPANSAGYVVDGLEPDTLYCFTVATTNGATGEPAFVPEACAVTDP